MKNKRYSDVAIINEQRYKNGDFNQVIDDFNSVPKSGCKLKLN
jgi:hypothetical protein